MKVQCAIAERRSQSSKRVDPICELLPGVRDSSFISAPKYVLWVFATTFRTSCFARRTRRASSSSRNRSGPATSMEPLAEVPKAARASAETTSSAAMGCMRMEDRQMGRRDPGERRISRAHWPRHGNAQRAPMRGLARGLLAHRAAWTLQLLLGVYPYCRFNV
jgi:hypothetical protein